MYSIDEIFMMKKEKLYMNDVNSNHHKSYPYDGKVFEEYTCNL